MSPTAPADSTGWTSRRACARSQSGSSTLNGDVPSMPCAMPPAATPVKRAVPSVRSVARGPSSRPSTSTVPVTSPICSRNWASGMPRIV